MCLRITLSLLCAFQSCFQTHFSNQTYLLMPSNDIHVPNSMDCCWLLFLFDTVETSIVLTVFRAPCSLTCFSSHMLRDSFSLFLLWNFSKINKSIEIIIIKLHIPSTQCQQRSSQANLCSTCNLQLPLHIQFQKNTYT